MNKRQLPKSSQFTLANLFQKLNTILINQLQKRTLMIIKQLTLIDLLKNLIIRLRTLRLDVKSRVLLHQLILLNAKENKTPKVSDLLENTDCDTKVPNIEAKYLSTSNYKRFTNKILITKTKEKLQVDKSDIFGLVVYNFELDKKKETLATEANL